MRYNTLAWGLGYARARIVLRLEAIPQTPGAQSAPFTTEQTLVDRVIAVLWFSTATNDAQPVLTLTFDPPTGANNYLIRATVLSTAGGAGFVQVQASCRGRLAGLEVCRV